MLNLLALCLSRGIRERIDQALQQHVEQAEQQLQGAALERGRDEGFAEALVALLRARGFDIPQPKRDEIIGEKNHARLQQWFERAVTATSLAEVFKEST